MNKRLMLIVGAFVVAITVFVVYRIALNSTRHKAGTATPLTVPKIPRIEEESVLLSKARDLTEKRDIVKAKEAYQAVVDKFPASERVPKIQESIEDLNVRILFSPIVLSDAFVYEVQKGDTLIKIAKKNNTTVELISGTNGISGSLIRVGQKLKISKTRFSIIVDKSQNILTLKSDDTIFKTYRISTGKDSSTPVGKFKIMNKIIDPSWYPPTGGVIPPGDSRNVLGSRWMGLSSPSYGIHGTTDPESIGKSVTEGCVRMKNSDVEELYSIVPEGTEVEIVD